MTSPHCTCHLIDFPANPPWDRCIACNAALDAADAARESGRNIATLTAAVDKLADALAGSIEHRAYTPQRPAPDQRALPAPRASSPPPSTIPDGIRPKQGPARGW